jgi:hypothetical protein
LPPEWLKWVRGLWFLALGLAVVLDIAGSAFVMRDVYRHDVVFGRLALSSQIENDGSVTFESFPGHSPAVPLGSRILSVDGEPVARSAPVWKLASLLKAKDGEVVQLRLTPPQGPTIEHEIAASNRHIERASALAPVDRNVRMTARMAISLLTCLTLIVCAVLLFARRPRDPVAMLFSFSFLIFASLIDPPMQLWLAAGLGQVFDVYAAVGWLLLILAIAAFPDGRFNPAPVRWIMVAAPIAAIPLSFEEFPLALGMILAFVAPIALLASHVIKYRRLQPGIERQQIKWAAFGFASGFVSLTAAFLLVAIYQDPSAMLGLLVLALFNLGFLAMTVGLLVSLLRFRLWEADEVIGRSAISAAVTLMVGIIWTLSIDGVKLGVEWFLGEDSEAIATAAGAILAAGIFAPTQALAMRWAKRRVEGDESRVKQLISRLAVWRTTEMPEEIGIRTLSALNAAVHCSSAALLVDTARGPRLLASRDVEQADLLSAPSYDPSTDRRFVRTLPLEDDDGPMGLLLIGPRNDLNRYNAAQVNGLATLTEPLAEALRASLKRAHHAESMQLKLGSVEERLARLEQGGGPRLSPT